MTVDREELELTLRRHLAAQYTDFAIPIPALQSLLGELKAAEDALREMTAKNKMNADGWVRALEIAANNADAANRAETKLDTAEAALKAKDAELNKIRRTALNDAFDAVEKCKSAGGDHGFDNAITMALDKITDVPADISPPPAGRTGEV
jgi:hypothetical protein